MVLIMTTSRCTSSTLAWQSAANILPYIKQRTQQMCPSPLHPVYSSNVGPIYSGGSITATYVYIHKL